MMKLLEMSSLTHYHAIFVRYCIMSPPKSSQTFLRNISSTDYLFSNDPSPSISDWINCNVRLLPRNETLVMALNEIAVQRGRGYFLYIRNRDGWRTKPGEELLP